MKVVIMAGGRGTRISEMFPDIPKPLIPIENIPVLEREIISLRDQGSMKYEALPHFLMKHLSMLCIETIIIG